MNLAKAMLRPRKGMLLSHTSEPAYDNSTPAPEKYPKYMGEETRFCESWTSYIKYPFVSLYRLEPRPSFVGTDLDCDAQSVRPLLFGPSDGWACSTGLNWVGTWCAWLTDACEMLAFPH